MVNKQMTSMKRVDIALSHQEPDRVPLFLLLTMHGAKELGMSIKDYFSQSKNVVEGQIRMQKKYHSDCYYPFFYAAIETEAFGGKTRFYDDGPPNSGDPVIDNIENIKTLSAPKIKDSPSLLKVLETIENLKEKSGGTIPIAGVVMSPFSLPIMQLGFERYLKLLYFQPDIFHHLMKVNESFCVKWANAQLNAGANFIAYFDPVSSSTIIPKEIFLKTGYQIARKTLAKIKGNTVVHLASGKSNSILDEIYKTGSFGISVSSQEKLSEIKKKTHKKLSLVGNLNGVEMRNWSEKETIEVVKNAIKEAAPGGGFILSDNHGEIPFQVTEDTLLTIRDTVREFGTYPNLNK